jgi:hypothetical protein
LTVASNLVFPAWQLLAASARKRKFGGNMQILNFVKFGAVLPIAFGAVLSPVVAQNSSGTPFSYTKPVRYFSPAAVEPVLSAMGHKAERAQTKSGKTYLRVAAKNGLKFNLHFTACGDGAEDKCKGISLSAVWTKPDRFSITDMASRTRKFNNKYNFINASMFDNGKPYILRYAIADYGTNQGNIRSEIANFIAIGSKFTKEVFAAE